MIWRLLEDALVWMHLGDSKGFPGILDGDLGVVGEDCEAMAVIIGGLGFWTRKRMKRYEVTEKLCLSIFEDEFVIQSTRIPEGENGRISSNFGMLLNVPEPG